MQFIKRSTVSIALVVLLAFGLFGCATQTTYDDAVNIVEASQVKSLMDSGAVVIDARGEEAYAKGHLDGAICVPPSALTAEGDLAGIVADQAQVEAVLSAAGITSDDTVLVYDDKGGVYSGRIWWVLKHYGHGDVRIINGGARALEKATLAMSADTPELAKSDYTISTVDNSMYADIDDVNEAIEGISGAKLIDVRSAAEYAEGFIPTAVNIAHTSNLYTDGTFKSKRAIELDYQDAGFSKDDAIILYCKTSFRATQTAALLQEVGYMNVKVYDGAWVEWESLNDTTVTPEENVTPTQQDAS